MFEKNSRYYTAGIATLQVVDSDGALREIRYILRRFIPSAEGATTLVEHTVTQGERLTTSPRATWAILPSSGACAMPTLR